MTAVKLTRTPASKARLSFMKIGSREKLSGKAGGLLGGGANVGHRDVLEQPEGLPEISRGLSVSDTPGRGGVRLCIPEGCQNPANDNANHKRYFGSYLIEFFSSRFFN
jgi:hypothetical protein